MRSMVHWSRSFLCALLLCAAAQPAAQAQSSDFPTVTPEAVGVSSAKLQDALSAVRKWVEDGRSVGAIMLVIRDGKTVLNEAVGWSDRERKIPFRTDHIVSMRSMTKPLVGVAIMKLREEGKLQLEDRVAQYLPSFDNTKSKAITIFQLLTHTSGLKGEIYTALGGTTFTNLREAVDAVGARGPEFTPGTDYFYSDPGTSTLGAIIAERSGMPAEQYITTHILQPLRVRSSFLVDDPKSPLRARVAAAYRRQDSVWVRYWDNTMPPIVPFFRASGGLYSTAHDYARFMAAMLGKGSFAGARVLAPASVELSTQPHAQYVYAPERRAGMTRFYGFNWDVYTDRFKPVEAPFTAGIFNHAGSDGTLAWADPNKNLIVIYLTQSRGSNTSREFVRLVYAALEK